MPVATRKALDRIDEAIHAAYLEAVNHRASAAISEIAEMSLIFARVAQRHPKHCEEMKEALRGIGADARSPVEEWQLARALYMLGEDRALCSYMLKDDAAKDKSANLFYLAQQAGDDGTGMRTLALLREHLEFAREKKSIPLLALFSRMTLQLIESKAKRKKWSTALGDLKATAKLASLIEPLVDRTAAKELLRSCGWGHDCEACAAVANENVVAISDAITTFRTAVSAHLKP